MKQVWKFIVHMNKPTTTMPENAQILNVNFQGGHLTLWALVDIEAPFTPRKILVRGTGHNVMPDGVIYIGTAFKDGLVFHVFEKPT